MNAIDTKIVVQDDTMFVGRSQDCMPIVEFAKAQQTAGYLGSSEMRHAACLPNVIIEKYCNDHNVTFEQVISNPDHIKRMCNDPDNAAFRIWRGQL